MSIFLWNLRTRIFCKAKEAHILYIKRKRFGHGYVEVFKEYETTRKLKKLEWEKDAFLFFFCPIFASDAWNMFWENWDTHARKQCELKCKALSLNCFKKRNKKFKGHFLTNRAPVYTQENFMSQIRLRNEKCFLFKIR